MQRLARHPSTVLPVPGIVWGRYPQRAEGAPLRMAASTALSRWTTPTRRRQREFIEAVRLQQSRWHSRDAAERDACLADLRGRLARDGWAGTTLVEALGCAAEAAERTLGRCPFDTQLHAAGALLDDKFAEMATGEGKTCAAALAAAVAALAGVPVHVMTANDYLVERDAREMGPLFAALGLRVGAVLGASRPDARRSAYACDVTYCTAREVAFDYLRDSLQSTPTGSELQRRSALLAGESAPAPLLRGLCMAILDEADGLLIDEATMPLVLSEAADDAQQRAACFQALTLARGLRVGVEVHIDRAGQRIELDDSGAQRLEQASESLDGAWHNRRHRLDLVGAALEALHLLERDQHYLVRDGRVQLLDALTGRTAPGRAWSRGLQTLVELKEGVAVTPTTTTRAQISFQRFFARYLRLCGMSGTLAECRREVRALYRREIVTIALRNPSRRRVLRDRLFVDSQKRWRAVARRVEQLREQGRPVLIGTDSVGDSQALSAALDAAAVPHRVLDARHDRDEADIVAAAGASGAVTVATRMAGRGTDIALGRGVAVIGGLHVLNCQDNRSARLDRQLIGRGARQGDPGSAQTWRSLDQPQWLGVSTLARRWFTVDEEGAVSLPQWLLRGWAAWLQLTEERRLARQRRRLLEQDREWERQLNF